MPLPYYWHHLPSEALSPFVDRYWGWEIPFSAALPMLMPGTGSECFFHFSSPPRLYSGQILPESYLVCPRHQITRFLPAEQLRFIAIRFKNGQLRHFTHCPFMELQDSLPPLTTVWGYAAEALYEQLLNTASRDEQIHHIEQFLLSRLRRHHTLRQISLQPTQELLDIALERGFSDQPHFNHEIQTFTGMTPGELQPLLRQQLHYYNPPSRTPE